MKFKFSLLFILSAFAILSAQASIPLREVSPDRNSPAYVNDAISKMTKGNMDVLLKMTPKQFEKMTGKKLTFKETLKLKAAQKFLKKKRGGSTDISKGVYIILAIFGWAWLAMGLMDDWSGNNWWVNLILTFLCYIPGLIHSLIKMKDYYGN